MHKISSLPSNGKFRCQTDASLPNDIPTHNMYLYIIESYIKDMDENDPTLTFNTIGRHLSQMVNTRIASVKSPWLTGVNVGDIHTVPISHGEGRFVAPKEVIEQLFENGQVFSQYVDENNQPTMVSPYNPNGSMMAIEGIVSSNGRVLGKMAHSERQGENRNKNIYGEMDQKLFEAGVNYFKGGK